MASNGVGGLDNKINTTYKKEIKLKLYSSVIYSFADKFSKHSDENRMLGIISSNYF
jgi:hypothetical protein